jgi:putative NIF3 family GTP cyclohydrolase 1 type 2
MDAKKLYKKLDKDFELDLCKDDWERMDFNEYISENFKERYMGLVLDNSKKIERIYTAVFPSDKILKEILESGAADTLLVTHHPMIWDIRRPNIFYDINPELLPLLKQNRISLYTMHVPLDKNGKYSTSVNLAYALDIDIEGEFFEYFGVKVGVYGKTDLKTPKILAEKLSEVVGHRSKLWNYGSDNIKNNMVAVVGGGGNDMDVVKELKKLNIDTFVTGVTVLNDFSKNVHEFEKENKINLIGGTHYSTEKFACIALCNYFKNIGLSCKFIEDKPILEDLEKFQLII